MEGSVKTILMVWMDVTSCAVDEDIKLFKECEKKNVAVNLVGVAPITVEHVKLLLT